ncbi:MAG: hypothetical protein GWN58_13885 [Anaerolineae bacterium]|nr:hypothetical protein [Anaerolineae bacterium]
MMTLNGMNFWNNNMDYAFRFLHMGDLLEMSKKSWDELPDAYRMRMQGTGVGKAQWSKIQKIHDQKRLTTWKGPYGDVTLPDPDKMGPDELALYKLSLDGYSSHGIIHPEFGDVPLYSDDPVGAMMFQFQGFAYAAQQKLARKLMKKGIQDPLTLQTLMAFGMFGVLSSLVRSTMYGEGEEWFESWTTPEGAIERTYELMVRSPLAVGASGMIGDLLMHSLQPINTITGTNLIPGASRRRQQDTIDIIGGPGVASINRFGKAVPGILGGIAEGSPGDVYDASKNILPFTSHIGVRALESALGDD